MNVLQLPRTIRDYIHLPKRARKVYRKDRRGLPQDDVGTTVAIREAMAWMYRAQDNSTSRDGGLAHHFSLIDGWARSYPETTGYAVPTFLRYAEVYGDDEARIRARRMLDWLVSIQMPDGGFAGGLIGEEPIVPVVFNTGQILYGLVSGAHHFGEEYSRPMHRAADWLVRSQDADGCWRKYSSPFAMEGERAYDSHVAWSLFEAARVAGVSDYADAARANIRWVLRHQNQKGWFDRSCLSDASQPLTHTLGYTLRGLIEAYRFTGDEKILEASVLAADGLLHTIRMRDGFLPGRVNRVWAGVVRWACLTGSVQIAICWLLLYQMTGKAEYRDAARKANCYVRRTLKTQGTEEIRGGIKGSFPVFGAYGPYRYVNWASKFFVDSNMLEEEVKGV